jgi:hypothetical protein
MNTYSAEQLLAIWKQENMTAEQAVGHLLQHLTIVYARLRKLERGAQTKRTECNKAVGAEHDQENHDA